MSMNSDENQNWPVGYYPRWKDPNYGKEIVANYERMNKISAGDRLHVTSAANITPRSIDWVYENLIAKGELTIIAGASNVGKSTLAYLLIAGITTEAANPLLHGFAPSGDGHVFLVDIENDHGNTTSPRLSAAGADLGRVNFIDRHRDNHKDEPFSFSNPKHIEALEGRFLSLNGKASMIVIDPVYVAINGDASNNALARPAYENLVALAKRLNCAIVGIAHTVKKTRNKLPLLSRLSGPLALQQVPRSILLVEAVAGSGDGIENEKVVVLAKNNLGRKDTGFAFVIEEVSVEAPSGSLLATRARITRTVHGEAEEIIRAAENKNSDEKITKHEAATAFLLEELDGGAQLKNDIVSRAEVAGIRPGTLHKAKADLKIVTRKRKGDGLSEWSLPA